MIKRAPFYVTGVSKVSTGNDPGLLQTPTSSNATQSRASDNIPLGECDNEQVHIPGAIQPHGVLLVVTLVDLRIIQASENCEALLRITHADIIGSFLSSVFGETNTTNIIENLSHQDRGNGSCHVLRLMVFDVAYDLFAHKSGDAIILEVEKVPFNGVSPLIDLYSGVRLMITKLQTTKTLLSFFDLVVSQIRDFTGFERVMVYKFLEDGSGHVIAEAKLASLGTYLDLHYPASDIPAPARRLFALSWLRHIPDVAYTPVRLMPELSPLTGEPVDMSAALLRSVSVIHRQYLKNMGTSSTMVMPLMKDGGLWGLISCIHHSGPRHLAHETRMAAEFLTHTLSLMMASKEDAEDLSYREHTKAALFNMMHSLTEEPNLHKGLGNIHAQHNVKEFIECGGAAVVTGDHITRLGNAPSERSVADLVSWLQSDTQVVFATDRLSQLYEPAKDFLDLGSGLLAIRLSKHRSDFIMWFRPEQATTVKWAGDPAKPVNLLETDRDIRLRPRGSFALWQQTVSGRSRPWSDFEIKAATDLKWGIVDVILSRTEKIERLNQELTDANSELNSFAYAASHDLKEPLRGITHLTGFLERSRENTLDGQGRSQLATIVRLTKRMDDLIDSLLHYAHIGRPDQAILECDLDKILDEALLTLQTRITESRALIQRPRPLPSVVGDSSRISEVLTNLISNAIKYNNKQECRVEIGWKEGNPTVFYVRDNGIGIADADREAIFQIFRRLHGRDEFGGGSGAGLTIARKVVQRHGGSMWIESVIDEGSTFWFTLSQHGSP